MHILEFPHSKPTLVLESLTSTQPPIRLLGTTSKHVARRGGRNWEGVGGGGRLVPGAVGRVIDTRILARTLQGVWLVQARSCAINSDLVQIKSPNAIGTSALHHPLTTNISYTTLILS